MFPRTRLDAVQIFQVQQYFSSAKLSSLRCVLVFELTEIQVFN